MGWIANILVLIGTWLIGGKKKIGFVFIAAGEALWIYVGLTRNEWDIFSICVVFTIMAGVNYVRWND